MKRVMDSLRRIHESGADLPASFDSFRIVEDYRETAASRGAEIPAAYEQAHGRAREIESVLSGPKHDPVPCHNDLLAGNFLRGSERIWIVDWEYAGMGDRYFDLGNFAVNNELDAEGEAALLVAYFEAPASGRRLASLRLMRFMSDFREAMWGVVQQSISELEREADFVAYANRHFDRKRTTAADARFDGWLEAVIR